MTSPDRPEIVVLCGSTRFYDEFRRQNLRLTLEGKIVLSIGCDTKSDGDLFGQDDVEALKTRLDELHQHKIDLADRVLVLNVGGYIGESTRSEIEHARRKGKPVNYLEPGVDLHRITVDVCELCFGGEPDRPECLSPGCAFYRHDVPSEDAARGIRTNHSLVAHPLCACPECLANLAASQ